MKHRLRKLLALLGAPVVACSVVARAPAFAAPQLAPPLPAASATRLDCPSGLAPRRGDLDEAPFAALWAPGEVVARLEVALPADDPFLLHGTVPVPPATFQRGSARTPFALRGADGTLVQTQVEVVAQRAREGDGAGVVEVCAIVRRPAGANPGSRVSYDLVRHDGPRVGFPGPPQPASELLARAGAVRLEARGSDGVAYAADLLHDIRTSSGTWQAGERGAALRRDRAHAVLMPVASGGATPAWPHGAGVQVFLTQHAHSSALRLDLQVHNAFPDRVAGDPRDDALHDFLFESLVLVAPSGWCVVADVADPYLGALVDDGAEARLPLVRAEGGSALHVLPQLSRFQRRLVLAPCAEATTARSLSRMEGLGFVVPDALASSRLASWWNARTPGYWPQLVPLPLFPDSVAQGWRASLASTLSSVEATLASGGTSPGGYPISSGVLGWAHPWGPTTGAMTGGDEIHLWDGVDVASARSVEGILLAQLRLRMYACRQPNSLYGMDGSHIRPEEWVETGGGLHLPVWWFNGPQLSAGDPFGLSSADRSQYAQAAAHGRLPNYDQYIRSYRPVDYQHYVRHTRTLKELCWLANDPLAKFELESQAEGWRLSYSPLPQTPQGGAISTGRLVDRQHVDAHPGLGVDIGRGDAWGVDALVAWHALAPQARRNAYMDDFLGLVDLWWDASSPCDDGLMAAPTYAAFGGQHRVRSQIEVAMLDHAMLGLLRGALDGREPCAAAQVQRLLERSWRQTISPQVWRTSLHGPLMKIGVGPFIASLPAYCGSTPAGAETTTIDEYQSSSSFAHAWRFTRDPTYLARACELHGWTSVQDAWNTPTLNWQNRLALLRLVQDP